MPVNLPPHFVITPITSATFTPERSAIVGRIEECTFGLHENLGPHLCGEGGREVYSHPSLFIEHWRIADKTAGWVHVALTADGTKLMMRPFCRRRQQVPSGEERFAEAQAPALTEISVDAVLLLAKQIRDAGGVCANRGCGGARERPLDLRRTVLVHRSGNLIPLCAHCFKQECGRIPDLVENVIIDGRRLPMRAPVAYLSAPPP